MIYTVGHSTHTELMFALLIGPSCDTIVDIRSHRSSKWPWWHQEKMERWLPIYGFRYLSIPDLGGWTAEDIDLAAEMGEHGVDIRPYTQGQFPKHWIARQTSHPHTDDPAWTNRGLYDYSWYMSTERFDRGLNQLLEQDQSCAILCAEAPWWKCHRSMVSDRLLWMGIESCHLMPKVRGGTVAGHNRTLHSEAAGNRLERYDSQITRFWGSRQHAVPQLP